MNDAHEHSHAHAHAPSDDDVALTEEEAKFIALKSLLIEKGLITADAIRARMEADARGTPHQGAGMVAKAWSDANYKARLLSDAKSAAIELGIPVTEAALLALENTPRLHNLIVCTLCSCYPRVSKAYRSRAVREPRKVLDEFGVVLADGTEVRVHDSNADLRYIVLPMRPAGTETLSEQQLAELVTRDCLVGTALPRAPG